MSLDALTGEWHPSKNLTLDSLDSRALKSGTYWWKCVLGHEWPALLSSRLNGNGCPYCSGTKLLAGFNDLMTRNPELASQWDSESNSPLTPRDVQIGSNISVYWLCNQGHSYPAKVNLRSSGTGCPYCAGQKVLQGFNDLASKNADLAKEWDYERNGELRPEDVTSGSGRKVSWICSKDHSFTASVNLRNQGSSCPYCSGNKVLEGFNDLASVFPHLAAEWDYERNAPLKPSEVMSGSPKSYFWLCSSKHSFKSSLASRSGPMARGCPYCAGQRVLKGVNDLASSHPSLAREWDYERNGPLSPEDVFPASARKVWWICSNRHPFQASLAHRSKQNRGCPYCAGQKVLTGFNDLETVNPELAREWDFSRNGVALPSQVTSGTKKKFFWLCSEQHSYQAAVSTRKAGTGCPTCAKYGFDGSQPGLLYLIENKGLRARKLGITNQTTKVSRLDNFAKTGWIEIASIQHDDGALIRDCETFMLRWLRKDIGLPIALSDLEMGREGGQSETFSIDGPNNEEILAKIKETFAELSLRVKSASN